MFSLETRMDSRKYTSMQARMRLKSICMLLSSLLTTFHQIDLCNETIALEQLQHIAVLTVICCKATSTLLKATVLTVTLLNALYGPIH